MHFVQFRYSKDGPERLGVLLCEEGDIIDFGSVDSSIPNNLVQFLQGGSCLREKVKKIVAERKANCHLKKVEVLAPVTNPGKIICVGFNYRAHCDETNKPYPKVPTIFNKFPSTIVGPNGLIQYPSNTQALDWEVELAVVIGKKGRNVPKNKAFDYVFGYTIAQDISARDWQNDRNNSQWLIAKSMDTFCPLGPSVVTHEDFGILDDKTISCSVNGKTKQSSRISDLIHKVDDLVTYVSQCFTLFPGDLILTGTPSGVGMSRNPKEFLKVGDVIVSEISGIGKLTNTVVKG